MRLTCSKVEWLRMLAYKKLERMGSEAASSCASLLHTHTHAYKSGSCLLVCNGCGQMIQVMDHTSNLCWP